MGQKSIKLAMDKDLSGSMSPTSPSRSGRSGPPKKAKTVLDIQLEPDSPSNVKRFNSRAGTALPGSLFAPKTNILRSNTFAFQTDTGNWKARMGNAERSALRSNISEM